MTATSADAAAAAFRAACADELAAAKPGNVHVHAGGHRMTVEDFMRSAKVAAGPLCAAGATLGGRVAGAVAATRGAVGQNTNLGIVLLCAPLAMAAELGGDLSGGVDRVLQAAGVADTAAVFGAIALASPGGLGSAPRHDVHGTATVPLRAAMAEAAGRDRIARQYATGFADVLGPLTAAYAAGLARHRSRSGAALAAYLHCLAAWPDTHVTRRHGAGVAEAVRAAAVGWEAMLREGGTETALLPDLLDWDAQLKRKSINPGTSADLTVATIFAHRLRNSLP